jgi:hypothetical protein
MELMTPPGIAPVDSDDMYIIGTTMGLVEKTSDNLGSLSITGAYHTFGDTACLGE